MPSKGKTILFASGLDIFTYEDYAKKYNVSKESAYRTLRKNTIKVALNKRIKPAKRVNPKTKSYCEATSFKECFNCPFPECIRETRVDDEPPVTSTAGKLKGLGLE